MPAVILESVSKVFRHRPALFNWLGRERTGETRALDRISLEAPSGNVLVLLGPNGSGKTTTLKLISTMLLPDEGRVLVQQFDTRTDSRAVRERVGFAVATERSFFPRLSARENLDFFATLDDIPGKTRGERVDELLSRTGLRDAADTLVMKFSSGMYQRLGIARALMKRPAIVLLDEPTRSLDPGSAAQFWNLVRELPAQGATVILTTHNFNEAVAVGNHVAILFHGTVAAERRLSATMRVDELRSFYFQTTGELEEVEPVASPEPAMNLPSLLDKTAVIVRRDLLTAVRYRTGFLLSAAGAITELAAFYYLSRAVGPGFRPEGLEYFSFLLVGTGFFTFLLMGVHSFLQTVQEAQQTGTLEVLMTTPTSPSVLVFLSAMSAFAANTVALLFYLAAGLVFGAPLHPNLVASVPVFLLSVSIAISIGLLAAALQLAIQKGSAVVWALGSVWFLTGTMFPVQTLPKGLRDVAQLIPITHSLEGMRLALLEGASLRAVSHELAVLAAFAIVLVPGSLWFFSWTLRRARIEGTLSFY